MAQNDYRTAPNTQTAEQNADIARPGEERIKVNGFAQVLEMLQAADPAFRESLLRRLAQRDPALVRNLRMRLTQQ